MFEDMMNNIRENVSRLISFVEIKNEVPENNKEIPRNHEKKDFQNSEKKKIPRNAICPLCDSGKKYKRCCGKVTN